MESAASLASLAEMRRFVDALAVTDAELRAATPIGVAYLAHEIADAMEREFRPHDRGPLKPGDDRHVRTIKTIRISVYGLTAIISMGGGAPYVQLGTRPHWIIATGRALHWQKAGQHFFAKKVRHPGSKSDPFVDRAVESVTGRELLAQMLARTSIARFFAGPGGVGSIKRF